MKQRYERGLRPWPGQQADQSETESVAERAAPTPQRTHPHQQPLFVRGDVSVLAADLARMMEDDDDDHLLLR